MTLRKAVIFDLGHVLVDIDWARAVRRIAPLTAIPAEEIIPRIVSEPYLSEYETGGIPSNTFLHRIASILDTSATLDEIGDIWSSIFIRRPGMEALLEETMRRAPVAILSDTNPLHWNAITAMVPLLATVPAVLSHEIRVRKPDPKGFHAAAQRCGVEPSHCLFLDDKQDNVLGAEAVGMKAFRFTTLAQARLHIVEFLARA